MGQQQGARGTVKGNGCAFQSRRQLSLGRRTLERAGPVQSRRHRRVPTSGISRDFKQTGAEDVDLAMRDRSRTRRIKRHGRVHGNRNTINGVPTTCCSAARPDGDVRGVSALGDDGVWDAPARRGPPLVVFARSDCAQLAAASVRTTVPPRATTSSLRSTSAQPTTIGRSGGGTT